MWLVVGLGNPGEEYARTRHNVGFEVLEELADRAQARLSERKFKARLGRGRLQHAECCFLKPQTFMNLVGESVGAAAGFYKVSTSEIIAIHDDLDLGLGRLKLKQGGGHGGHNGLRNLLEHLPDPEFLRIRVGVGRPPPKWDPVDYVLSRFSVSDRGQMDNAVKEAATAAETIIRDGIRRAMNVYNRASAPEQEA